MKNKTLKNSQTKKFSLLLLVVLLVAFSIHVHINESLFGDLYANSVILTYVINYFIAILIFGLMIKYMPRIENTLGFYFMAGSFFKFLVFFVVFQPIFKENGSTDKAEFVSYFAPYALSLSFEVYFLVKLLNKRADLNPSGINK